MKMTKKKGGFTLVELLVASTLMALVGIGFVSFVRFSGYSMVGITQQSDYNQAASSLTSLMVKRVRDCRTAVVSNGGYTLTLTFDDDASVDSDSDGFAYNDTDHTEVFEFYDNDDDLTTLSDNGITHQSAAGEAQIVLAENVGRIGTNAFFEIDASNSRLVNFCFELSSGNSSGRTQRIDIVTNAYRRN